MIIDKLITRIIETRNPSVVGLDPRPEYIPSFILKETVNQYADPCEAMAHAVFCFNKALIDALCDIVPAVKPQIAFYEQYGAAGIACYRDTVAYAKEKGMITIGDVKRGDITAVAQAYADAHIGRVAINGQALAVFDTDFVTVNPYMGYDVVVPFLENMKKYDKGIFVLVKTSNPGSGDIQDIDTAEGKVYEVVGDKVRTWGEGMESHYGYNPVGAVVGVTHPEQARALRKRMPRTFFLAPGYGAQGGSADDVRACFNADGMGAIINNSRGIIAAYLQPVCRDRFSDEDFASAAREAALAMRDALGYAYETYR